MPNLSNILVDQIGQHCVSLFGTLPKTGKPTKDEWTVLSCFLQYDNISGKFDVVSLGTGSKCIGATKLSPFGVIMNDSHAEVYARRGLLLYFYQNVENALENKDSIFEQEDGRFKLKGNIEFIFYSSQLPCGDASIMPKNEDDNIGDVLQSNKRQARDEICDVESKKQKVNDVYRTGAKCLPHCEQDLKESGLNYHILGQVRTKPGRGDRTLSVSCSDKIAKWIHLGVQGRLLDMFMLKEIFINHFIFGGGVPYSEESLKRALLKRDLENPVTKYIPCFHQTTVIFPHIKTEKNVRAAPGSIIWTKLDNAIHEVSVQGKKLGVTKKKAKLMSSSLCISKYNIYKRFQQLLHKNVKLKENISDNPGDVPYNKMKAKAERYEKNWLFAKREFFKTWTIKPDIWDFCVNIT